ncbi:hypothetical protein RCC89_04235 [Cytophagaceae bacterium ABcell3]|nr:hypothetical protein RCC89_04235 [Cytophagaceae bacterium ABcell3]
MSSMFQWGLGTRFDIGRRNITFNVDINGSRTTPALSQKDSLLRFIQVVPSTSFLIFQNKPSAIYAQAGILFTNVTDNMQRHKALERGFRLGISLQRQLPSTQILHLDFRYDMLNSQGAAYRNYDTVKIVMGVFL